MTLLRCKVVCLTFSVEQLFTEESIASKNTNGFVNDSIVSGLLINVGVNGTDTVEAGDWEGYFKFIEQTIPSFMTQHGYLIEFYLKTALPEQTYLCLITRI